MGQLRDKRVFIRDKSLLFLAILCSLVASLFLGAGFAEEAVASADQCTYTVSSDEELGTANASVRLGELVCLRSGTYQTAINPSSSGSQDGGHITYQAVPGERPVMVGTVDLSGKSYLVIDSVVFESGGHAWVRSDDDSHHIQFLGCEFDSSQAGSWRGLSIIGDYFILRDSVFGDWWDGDMVYVRGSHALIEHNDFSQARGAHSLISLKGTHTIVRRNYFRNPWDRAMTIGWKGNRKAERILVEENVFIDNNWNHSEPDPDRERPLGADQAVKFNVSRSVFRNNLIVNTNEGNDYDHVSALSFSTYGTVLRYEHLRIYHNTLYRNRNNAISFKRNTNEWYTEDNKLKNNVIAESEDYALNIARSDLAWASYLFDTNVIYDSTKEETIYIKDGGLAQTVHEAQRWHANVFVNNIVARPQFQNASILDDADAHPENYSLDELDDFFYAFSLQNASSGKGDGTFLSVVTESATDATMIEVDDALFFSDGLGLIPGDSIIIGQNSPVRVVQVVDDTSLMVDQASDVLVGDRIYLEDAGRDPDIGVYAFGSSKGAPDPPAGATVKLHPVADAFVSAEFPSQNYGDSVQLEVDGRPEKIAYLSFDLSSLSGMSVDSAKLRFRIIDQGPGSSDSTQNVKFVSDASWREDGITYSARPDLGNTIATIMGGTAGSFGEVDVTAAVQSKVGQLLSLGIDSAGSNGLDFYSKEHSIADQRPVLVVTGAMKLYPVADAFVSAEFPSQNYGDSVQLEVDGRPAKIAYLSFDLSSLSGMTVDSATLRFRTVDHDSGSSDATQNVKIVSDASWLEDGITYSARPSLGNTIATIVGGTAGSFGEVEVTAAVQSKVGQLLCLGIDSAGTDGLDFYSKEHSIADQRPVLVVIIQGIADVP